MENLKEDRNTAARDGSVLMVPAGAGVMIYCGAIVGLSGDGFAVPATKYTRGLGRAESRIDNLSGGNGDINAIVRKGVFRYDQDGSITKADIGLWCYALDDHTVGRASYIESEEEDAGIIFDVDFDGVWVRFR